MPETPEGARKILSIVVCTDDRLDRESLLYRRLMSARLEYADKFEIVEHTGVLDTPTVQRITGDLHSEYVVFVHARHILSANFVVTALNYLTNRTVYLAEPHMFFSKIPALAKHQADNAHEYLRSTDLYGACFNVDRLLDFLSIAPDLDRRSLYLGYRLYWSIGVVNPLETGYSTLSTTELTNGLDLGPDVTRLLPVIATTSAQLRIQVLHHVVLFLKAMRRTRASKINLSHVHDLLATLNVLPLLGLANARDPFEAAFIRWIAGRSTTSELYKELHPADFHLKFRTGDVLEEGDVALYRLAFGDELVSVNKAYIPRAQEPSNVIEKIDWYANRITESSTILMFDRTNAADDNAEYFYRWMRDHHPEFQDIHFALSPKSPDWARLEEDGFNLVEFWSPEFVDCFLDSDVVVSSQIYNINRGGKSMKNSRLVYLQHGIQLNDMRDWVVSKHYDVFIATGRDEADYLSEVAPREVLNSGIPRLEYLSQRKDEKDSLLFMPTWRYSLNQLGAEGFRASDFYRNLDALFTNPQLLEHLARQDKVLKVKLHPNLEKWAGLFHFSERVVQTTESYQDALATAEFVFTDYSSVVLDAAFIGTPIAYYQWDRASFFAEQPYENRVDFETDGLGPVLHDMQEMVEHITTESYRAQDPEFDERRARFFEGIEPHRINETIFERMLEL